MTLTLSARRRRGANSGLSSAPKSSSPSSSTSSSRSTSRESSTAPSEGVNARLAAASSALSPRRKDPGRKSDIDWLHAYTLIAPAAMLVKSACVAPSHIGPQTTTATRRAVSRANARLNARSAMSSTSPGFNSDRAVPRPTVFAAVSVSVFAESNTTRAASTAAASASRSASTPASVTDRIARIARRRSSEVESTSDLHTAASIRAPASSRDEAAVLRFRSRSSSAFSALEDAAARSSRLRTSTLRSLVASVASSASDPSAPAHTAIAAATTLGSSGDSPASRAQTKAVRNP